MYITYVEFIIADEWHRRRESGAFQLLWLVNQQVNTHRHMMATQVCGVWRECMFDCVFYFICVPVHLPILCSCIRASCESVHVKLNLYTQHEPHAAEMKAEWWLFEFNIETCARYISNACLYQIEEYLYCI